VKALALVLAATVSGAASPRPDLGHGEAIYVDRCQSCHGSHGDGQAPTLVGVVGRTAASAPGWVYSRPLSTSGLVWTPDALDIFLTDPQRMIPGTAMPIGLAKPQDRADLIAYLATLGAP
jgi:cytochrome c